MGAAPRTILSAALLAALVGTGCATAPPACPLAPGTELSMLIMQPEFLEVASKYPLFGGYIIRTVTRLELEQSWSKLRMFEAQKAARKPRPAPSPPPTPPPLPALPIPATP